MGNVIDRRKATTHGLAGLVGFLLGLVGRGLAPSTGGPDDDLVQLVSTALDRGQEFWSQHSDAPRWRDAHVVLIDSPERSACGVMGPETGPSYCPPSERIYVDLSFLREIHGDLARAYVISHELGHHVQKVRSEYGARPSVDVELQADCYAGRWMRDELDRGHVSPGDVTDALAEAAAVGDDRICPTCSSEQWTHGTAAQRSAAVQRGLGGDLCN